jgi:hypothetical protein
MFSPLPSPQPQNWQVPACIEGVIHTVDEDAHRALFVVPDWDETKLFGPARYGDAYQPPQPGSVCLVMFAGSGLDRPWIVAWDVSS